MTEQVTPDPKPTRRKGNRPRRIIDHEATRAATLADPECAACYGPGANGHHVVPKGAPHFGDDVAENIINLCGTGTSGCHGAWHGNPYTGEALADPMRPNGERVEVRRDQEWVRRRCGRTLIRRRTDVIGYALGKLGDERGRDYLERVYMIRLDDDGQWRQSPAAAPLVTA